MDEIRDKEPADKSAFQEIGDDKGEGGQQDIRTDRLEGDPGTAQSEFVQEPPAEKGALAEAAERGPTGESAESAPAGAGKPKGHRQQGDEDLDADRKPGQAMH
jgi:hypothetical protein